MTLQAYESYLLRPYGSLTDATGAVQEDSLAVKVTERAANGELWEKVINECLIDWGLNPGRLEEDDLIPPTRQALQVAGHIAQRLRDSDAPPPKRVVPDRDGGLAMERWEGECTTTIVVSADGGVEIIQWRGSTIVASRQLD